MTPPLDPIRWRKLAALFRRSLDLAEDQRREHIRLVRSSDPDLADELASLLSAHAAAQESDRDGRSSGVRRLSRLDPHMAAGLLSDREPSRLPHGASLGPYRVVRFLGRGGMGDVYLGEDPRLDRPVALKLLPPWLAADNLARRRFSAEARAASSLDHPNITTIYAIDETPEGRLYIAMAYYDGETLAQRIERGPLPVEETVGLGGQIASGLQVAHGAGIIHRDIKPSNVIVTADGSAKILDFGVAKIRGSRLTADGVVPGTAAYMSPEQTRGDPCDARSDLWSLGVVLFEMLTGQRPFGGRDDRPLVHRIRHDDPPSVLEARPDAPVVLAALVDRLLAKDPDGRPASAGEVVEALRAALSGTAGAPTSGSGHVRPGTGSPAPSTNPGFRRRARWGATALVVFLGLAASAVVLLEGRGGGDASPTTASASVSPSAVSRATAGPLAVMPLADLGSGPEEGHLAAGLTAELTTRLGRLPGLTTVAHTSTRRFGETELTAAEIGRRLRAATLLEGSVWRGDGRVRIALRLVETAGGETLWAETFDADVADVLSTQETIARRVASALRIELALRDRPSRRSTRDSEAYLTYLEARYHWDRRTPDGIRRARELYQEAIDRDPVFAEAWAGLSGTYLLAGSYGMMSAEEAFPRARASAERALEIDPDLAEAQAALAGALKDYYWDWEEAERRLRQAIDLRPDYAPAHYWLSELLAHRGRTREAVQEARRAQELDPLSRLARADEGRALYYGRRYDEAIAVFEETLQDGPNFVAYLYAGLAHAAKGELDRAVATLEAGRDAYPRISTASALLGYAYGRAGRTAAARRVLRELLAARERGTPVAAIDVAALHVGLGQPDEALTWLETAMADRDWQIVFLGTEPIFDPLRSDPRFRDLLSSVEALDPATG